MMKCFIVRSDATQNVPVQVVVPASARMQDLVGELWVAGSSEMSGV